VDANPVTNVDPSGQMTLGEVSATVSIMSSFAASSVFSFFGSSAPIGTAPLFCASQFPSEDKHLSRNKYNRCPLKEPVSGETDCEGRTFFDYFLDVGDKYRATDGCECGYGGNVIYGTFNFGPDPFSLAHACQDFFPHIWYNLHLGKEYNPKYPTIYTCS
jgi:hypothetical protein